LITESSNKRETCALLGGFPKKPRLSENFMTTAEVISQSIKDVEVGALLKPLKLLGDYDVSAGEEGTPEVTKKYLKMTPGQFSESLNTIIAKNLLESNMDTSYTTDSGGKLKSFDQFATKIDFTDIEQKAATPEIITMDFKGNVVNKALIGTGVQTPNAASTVEMTTHKEQALKRLAQFIASFQSNNQQLTTKKEDF
jgi:hypothetical protein